MIMQESVLYIVLALLCVVIYLLITQRKNKGEAKNSEEFDKLWVRLDIDHALPIWNNAKDSISKSLVT